MKTLVRLLTKYGECEFSSDGLKRTRQIKTLSVVARARVEANLTSYMWFLQTNNALLPMEDSLLTSTNSMMNDNVYYCILSSGLASQKTDNVTN